MSLAKYEIGNGVINNLWAGIRFWRGSMTMEFHLSGSRFDINEGWLLGLGERDFSFTFWCVLSSKKADLCFWRLGSSQPRIRSGHFWKIEASLYHRDYTVTLEDQVNLFEKNSLGVIFSTGASFVHDWLEFS